MLLAALPVSSSPGELLGTPLTWSAIGLAVGLVMFWRGLFAYRRGLRVSGIGTSRIATAAAGEVRIAGRIVPAETLLGSPVEGRECVYFRASASEDREDGPHYVEAVAATEFLVQDESGSMRVFPRGAQWDVPGDCAHATPGEADRYRQRAGAQLRVSRSQLPGARHDLAWLGPGDEVTVIGTALPYGELGDDQAGGAVAADDPEIAADLAEAAAAGAMASSAEEAWGNAAIPGFGIGRPVRSPILDPAIRPAVAAGTESSPVAAHESSPAGLATLAPDALVLAAGRGRPLQIFAGMPADAVARADTQFLLGALGAGLAIASALATAYLLIQPVP